MMMSIALRFIPTLMDEASKIMKAQTARGADFESGNLIQRAKAMVPLLVPLFVGAFRRADELALAMEARCYRGGAGSNTDAPAAFRLSRCDCCADHDDVTGWDRRPERAGCVLTGEGYAENSADRRIRRNPLCRLAAAGECARGAAGTGGTLERADEGENRASRREPDRCGRSCTRSIGTFRYFKPHPAGKIQLCGQHDVARGYPSAPVARGSRNVSCALFHEGQAIPVSVPGQPRIQAL